MSIFLSIQDIHTAIADYLVKAKQVQPGRPVAIHIFAELEGGKNVLKAKCDELPEGVND